MKGRNRSIGAAATMAILAGAFAAIVMSHSENNPIVSPSKSKVVSPAKSNVTKATFDRIEKGMTLDQVKEIFGKNYDKEGFLIITEPSINVYIWHGVHQDAIVEVCSDRKIVLDNFWKK